MDARLPHELTPLDEDEEEDEEDEDDEEDESVDDDFGLDGLMPAVVVAAAPFGGELRTRVFMMSSMWSL